MNDCQRKKLGHTTFTALMIAIQVCVVLGCRAALIDENITTGNKFGLFVLGMMQLFVVVCCFWYYTEHVIDHTAAIVPFGVLMYYGAGKAFVVGDGVSKIRDLTPLLAIDDILEICRNRTQVQNPHVQKGIPMDQMCVMNAVPNEHRSNLRTNPNAES